MVIGEIVKKSSTALHALKEIRMFNIALLLYVSYRSLLLIARRRKQVGTLIGNVSAFILMYLSMTQIHPFLHLANTSIE